MWRIKMGCAVAAVFLLILLDLACSEKLFDISVELISGYARLWEDVYLQAFALVGTDVLLIVLCGIAIVYVLSSGPKIKHCMLFLEVVLGIYLTATIKNIHMASRPCWASLDIPVIADERDFGSPSGHSLNSATFVGTALVLSVNSCKDLALSSREKKIIVSTETSQVSPFVCSVKIILMSLGYFLFVLLMFSRIFVGAHSINQVLYGFSWGGLITACVWYFFRDFLIIFFKYLHGQLVIEKNPIICNDIRTSLYLVLILTGLMIPNVLLYVLREWSISPKYLAHIQKQISDFTTDTPLAAGLNHSAYVSGIFGICFGIIAQRRWIEISPDRISLPVAKWKLYIRIILSPILAGIVPMLFFIFIPSNGTGLFILRIMVPSFLFFFLYFFLNEWLLNKLNLLPDYESITTEILPKSIKESS